MLPDPLPAVAWQCAAAVTIACLIAMDAPKARRLKRHSSAGGRLSVYRSASATLWLSALLAIAATGPAQLYTVAVAGSDMAWLLANAGMRWGAVALVCAYFLLALWPALHCALWPRQRDKYLPALAPMRYLLPVAAAERRWWVALSLSAGVCEEIVFRGLAQQLLHGQPHGAWHVSLSLAWLLGALLFGLCHVYQGPAGIAKTALAGLMFGLLAILTGSLLLPVLLHVLVDLGVLLIYRPGPDTGAEGQDIAAARDLNRLSGP
ncbi:MAG TPA: CPBP family intramembrane glutamic endopeptidase [Burkholderiaceae bacterium]